MWQNNSDSLHPHLSTIKVQLSQLIDKKPGMKGLDLSQPKRSTRTRGLVPATSPFKSLHEGTGRWNLSHEQFTRSVFRNKSQGLVQKI